MFLSRSPLTKIGCKTIMWSWTLLLVLVPCTVNTLLGVEINNYLVLQPPYDRAYGYAGGEQDLNSRTDYNHVEDTTAGKVYVKAISESVFPLFSPPVPFGSGRATAYSSLFPARVKCIHTSDYEVTFCFNIKGNAGVDNGSLVSGFIPIPGSASARAKATLGALVYDVDEDYKVILKSEREIYDEEAAWIPFLFNSFEYFDEGITISETISLAEGHEYLLEGYINTVAATSFGGMAAAKAVAMFDSGTIHWGDFIVPVDGCMELKCVILEDLFPQEPELLAYWNFDEGTGSVANDSSGNGNDGTIYGAAWTAGRIGYALGFDGVDDWVDVPDDISPEHITLEAWIYPTGFDDSPGDQGNPIITKETGRGTPPWSESFAWRLRITPRTHKLQLQCFTPTGSPGGGNVISDTALEIGNWYHVAGTYDGTRTKVYIDGNLEGSYTASISEPLVTSNLPTAIGHLPNWSVQWFQGIIDEARIYDKALPDSEIEMSADVEPSAPEPEPVDDLVSVSMGRVGYDRRTGQFSVNVTINNMSVAVIGSPAAIVIETISSPNVTVANADGTTSDGKPYIELSGLLENGVLCPGESVATRVCFNNPNRVRFTFQPSVWGVILP